MLHVFAETIPGPLWFWLLALWVVAWVTYALGHWEGYQRARRDYSRFTARRPPVR